LCCKFWNRLMINANTYKILIPLDYQAGIMGHNSFLANVDLAFALRQHELASSGDFQRAQECSSRKLTYTIMSRREAAFH
jgi:hypothetical protein